MLMHDKWGHAHTETDRQTDRQTGTNNMLLCFLILRGGVRKGICNDLGGGLDAVLCKCTGGIWLYVGGMWLANVWMRA